MHDFVFLPAPRVDVIPVSRSFGEFVFWSSCSSQSGNGFFSAWLDSVIAACVWGRNLECCLVVYIVSVEVVLSPLIVAQPF